MEATTKFLITTRSKDDLYRLVYTLLFLRFTPTEDIKGKLTPNYLEKGMILQMWKEEDKNMYTFVDPDGTEKEYKTDRDVLVFIKSEFGVSKEDIMGSNEPKTSISAFKTGSTTTTSYLNEVSEEHFKDSIVYGMKDNLKRYKFKKPIEELNKGVVKMQFSRISKSLKEGEEIFNTNLNF